jgi:hypothetical protein
VTLSYRTMFFLAVALGVAVVVFFQLTAPASRDMLSHNMAIGTSLSVVLCSLYAARVVGVRARLGGAWVAFAVAHVLLTLAGIVFPGPQGLAAMSRGMKLFFPFGLASYNVAWIVAVVLFARVWSGTGLVPRWRPIATLVAGVLALAVAAPALMHNLQGARHLDPLAAGFVISDVTDIVSVTIIGPILVTALMLRGGALVWTWMLLCLSSLAWLLNDITQFLGPAEQVAGASAQLIADVFAATAALAQAKVTRQAGREGDAA